MWYRLVYRNGDVSNWTQDIKRVVRIAIEHPDLVWDIEHKED